MCKHGGTPSGEDKHVTSAAISPPGVEQGRFVGGQQSGLAGCKPPPLFTRGASSCSSQGRRRGEPRGASPRPSAPTYLPTYLCGVVLCWAAGCLVCCAAARCAVFSCVPSCCAAAPPVRCCVVLCWRACVVLLCCVLLCCSAPACLLAVLAPCPPPPPGVRAVPCAVCCHLAVLPFRLVFCAAVLPCSVLRVEVWCPALLCCGLPSAGRVVWLPWWRCVLLSGFPVCCRVLCPWVLCCAALLRPVFAVVCCAVLLRPFGGVLCALPGFAAPGGRCCLASVLVPWL